MINLKIVDKKNDWEKFIIKHSDANFLQSWYWGEFHESLGKKIFRYGFYQENELIGVMLSIVEDAKRGRYLTVPGGPIIDWADKELAKVSFEIMRKIARENSCDFVRVRPQLLKNTFSIKLFKNNNFRPAPMYLHAELTSQLDITKSEEELLSAMRKNTRYEIRKAEKLGIEILRSESKEKIKDFYNLQIETAKRQRFVPFSYHFFKKQFEIFFAADSAILYTAKLGNKILSEAFVIFYGSEAVYHYGASTKDGRRYPGAYLIQWEAIKEAKKRGMIRYNFWGISPNEEKNHRFSGISLFKRGFGGIDVQYLPAHDLVIDPFKYSINYVIEKLRRFVRKV